eukprot:SAG31_NODE_515_length_14710_cov_6.289097_10_plen_119_part_00
MAWRFVLFLESTGSIQIWARCGQHAGCESCTSRTTKEAVGGAIGVVLTAACVGRGRTDRKIRSEAHPRIRAMLCQLPHILCLWMAALLVCLVSHGSAQGISLLYRCILLLSSDMVTDD